MSSVSRSKNVSSKPSGNAIGGTGTLISGYNPVVGKFRSVDKSAPSSVPHLDIISRFNSIDMTNDPYGLSIGSRNEDDVVSNNSSWSGDSEDQKEKPPHHIPLCQADNEKREKIRQKNEKKHQRQKERRAQELHKKCSGFLMSRKLEALLHQLVAMGFSSERATAALIMNRGKMEESISWLIGVSEGADKHEEHNLHVGNLNVDISDELTRIADMEIRYKCSKQDVERAIVSCDGDLGKAEELLSAGQSLSATKSKPSLFTFAEHKEDEKNFSCTKKDAATVVELGREHWQDMEKSQPKLDLPPSLQRTSPLPKLQSHYVVLQKDFKNQQLGKQDPVVLMGQPQSDNPKWAPPTGNVTRSVSTKQMYDEDQHHRQARFNTGTCEQRRGNSSAIPVASSLGLYSSSGSTSGSSGPSSPVDWSSVGSLLQQLDYTTVDWTLNPSPPRSQMSGMWQGVASAMHDKHGYDPIPSAVTPWIGGFREWSSPFEQRDMFSLSREFVAPPSL